MKWVEPPEAEFFICGNGITFRVNHYCDRVLRRFGVVYSRKKILVRTKMVSFNNLYHLTREEGESARTGDINFLTNFKIRTNYCLSRLRMYISFTWIFKNYIPVFRGRDKELLCFFRIISFSELLCLFIKYYESFLSAVYSITQVNVSAFFQLSSIA